MPRIVAALALAFLLSSAPASSMTTEERRQYLEKLLQILPDVPSFKQWLDKTGELPPDFDALPRINGLPDPLKPSLDGKPVRTAADWKSRRSEIRQLYEKYDLGTIPPKPKLDQRGRARRNTRQRIPLIRNVRLEFGPGSKGKSLASVQVMIPEGKGPFPVLMAPSLAGWGPSLLRRGYISAGYAANDAMDDAAPLAQLYPEYDFALIPRRAWVVGLVLDYLETVPQVDMKHVGLFGYSRDGKAAAIAAALDDRIAAVVAGSTGVGGDPALAPFRRAQLRRRNREHHTQFPHLVRPATALLFRTRGPSAHRRESSGRDDRPTRRSARIRTQ